MLLTIIIGLFYYRFQAIPDSREKQDGLFIHYFRKSFE